MALRFNSIGVAFKLFIDGKAIYSAGKVAQNEILELPEYKPGVVEFDVVSDTVDVTIWVSNYHHYRAGIWKQIWLGEESIMRNEDDMNNFFDWFLIGGLLIMGIYHVSLYLLRKKDLSNLIFGILTLIFVIRIGINGNMFFSVYLKLPWEMIVFLEYFTFYLVPFIVVLFLKSLFPEEQSKYLYWIAVAMAVIFLIPVFVTSTYFYTRFPALYRIYVFGLSFFLIYNLIRSLIKGREGAGIFLIGFTLFTVFTIIDLLSASYIIYTRQYAPFGILIFIFSQSFLLNLRFVKTFNHVEEMANKLDYQNKNLESIVEERTHEIELQNEDISIKARSLKVAYDEINEQHKIVLGQKEAIENYNKNINAALRYAYNIQKSILPTDEYLKEVLNDYFLLYLPKDIVSGDFYWVTHKNKMKYLAIADCTGHGVPGAFMSILGITILSETVTRFATLNPSEMLRWLQTGLKNLIRQDESNGLTPKDGMDIVFCVLDPKNMVLYYAGARMHMIIIRNNAIIELPVENLPMGIDPEKKEYATYTAKVEKNDMLYIFTDGYVDQFGGEKDKKYSTKRFYKLLTDICFMSCDDQKDALDNALLNWMTNRSFQIDDITVLGIRI